MRALVIDDAAYIRRIIKGILMGSCHFTEVDECENGEIGVLQVLSNPLRYHLIVLDWNMPVKNGIEFLREIRCREITIPVMMCTSEGDKLSIINAIKAGTSDYILKPFTGTVLEAKVSKIMNHHNLRSTLVPVKRALVIDDSKSVRAIISKTLRERMLCTDIVEADDGDVGIEKFEGQKFDVVILDWEMPRMNGIEVLRQIRITDITTPVIMATANTEIDHMVKAFDAGATNFISKPFQPDELAELVKQTIQ